MRDALGSVQRILVLGGASDIGLAVAAKLAEPRQAAVVLAGRSPEGLEAAADDLRARVPGAPVACETFDARATETHHEALDDLWRRHGGFDVVVLAFGVQGDQARAELDTAHALEIVEVNYLGGVSAGLEAGRLLREQGHGSLVVLSSVAGERPRRSLFVYGSSKAGLDAFALGLGDALRPEGVHVLVVRPGFVRTKLTAHLKPAPLATTPDAVAAVVAAGLRDGKRVVWAPPPLRWVMTVLRHLPHAVFRRLPL
jgi:decaprenylphospho-beta-D-erythro-pentofuranosid-2-ulose 2-reductase